MPGPICKHVLIFAGGGLTPVSGGVGTLLQYLMDAWRHDIGALPVRIVDTRGPGGLASAAVHFGGAIAALIGAWRAGTVACAHIHMTTRGSAIRKAVLCYLAQMMRVPVVLHLHGADFFEFHAALPVFWRRVLRGAIARAGAVIVIGADWRARLVRDLGVPHGRVRIVLNGVPAAPAARAGATPHILFLGRIGERKGVGDLIAALGSCELRDRAWTATIAGDGDDTAYRAAVAAHGLQDRVAMPGWRCAAETDALLASASVLVLPSHHEVMPMAVLEAMARGVAVVTTPVGSIPEILEDGVTAALVPPGAPDHLARVLGELIDDPARRARLGAAARRVWMERLDVAVTAAEIQAIYRSVRVRSALTVGPEPVAA